MKTNKDYKIVNPLTIKNWNELIIQHKEYSFFHSKEWINVLCQSYGYKPLFFVKLDNDRIYSLIPSMRISSIITGKRLVSLPFSDHCDSFFNSIEDSKELQEEMISYAKKNQLSYIEFRSSDTKFPFTQFEFRTDLRHILNLETEEYELYKSFSDNTKRNIKKALKENVSIIVKNDIVGLKIFYDMICETRQKHGLPPQPYNFFRTIYRSVLGKNMGDLIFAKHNEEFISGAMYFKIGNKILYKFGASFARYNHLRGNQLLMWEAIRKYKSEGYKELDFGRTEINHEGLRRFKLSFNAEERLIYTTRFDINTMSFISPDTRTNGFYNTLFNKTPISVLKMIGNTFYKHIG